MLTQERLKEVLSYDPVTGVFTWVKDTGKKRYAGKIAGGSDQKRYWTIAIDGRRYVAHRLAWLYVYGEWPPMWIDHINCNGFDNRLANLRLADATQNQGNKSKNKNNTSGFKGVHYHRQSRKWRASIFVNYKPRSLGLFLTREEASAAYRKAAVDVFGPFAKAD